MMYPYSTYSYSYISAGTTFFIIALLVAVILAVVLYFTFFSKKNEGKFTGTKGKIYNFFCFNKFYVEEVMKLLYLVSAVVITVIGIGTLFETFIGGLLVIVVGNIALRVGYELMMMFIILCRKTVSIDRKLEKMTGSCDDDTAGGECCRGEKTEDVSPETETADEDRINQSER